MFKPFMQFQYRPKTEIEKLQEKKLKRIISIATSKVPFYKKYKNDIDFDNFTLAELKKLPVVSKEIILEDPSQFIREDRKINRLRWKSTSGSSGKPFKVAKSYYSDAHEVLLGYRAWSLGANKYRLRDPAVVLRSYSPRAGEKIYKRDVIRNFWYLSPYHINEENLQVFLKVFKKSKAKVLKGYPSSIYILTQLLKQKGIRITSVKTIVTSSEMMLPKYRKEIESYWNIRVLDWYGQNERTAIAQQCDNGTYHNNDDYGIIEIDKNKNIIATSIINDIMPLIRYNTKDRAMINNDMTVNPKCACGREMSIPFQGIYGRADDIIYKDDNTPIPTINFYTMMDSLNKIKQFYILQNEDYSITMKLTESSPLDSSYLKTIEGRLKQRVGQLPISIKIVKEIERNLKTDKVKIIESKVKL